MCQAFSRHWRTVAYKREMGSMSRLPVNTSSPPPAPSPHSSPVAFLAFLGRTLGTFFIQKRAMEEEPEDASSLSWHHACPGYVSSIRPLGGASVNPRPQGARAAQGGPKTSHFTRMEFHDLCILIKFLFLWNFS